MKIALSEDKAQSARCAYCLDRLLAAEYTCAGCRTRLHWECRQELSACPVLGCRRPFPADDRPTGRGERPGLLRRAGPLVLFALLVAGGVTGVSAYLEASPGKLGARAATHKPNKRPKARRSSASRTRWSAKHRRFRARLELLVRGMGSEDVEQRRAATGELARTLDRSRSYTERRVIDLLARDAALSAVGDPDRVVRTYAARALLAWRFQSGRRSKVSPGALAALLRGVRDPEPRVRLGALRALPFAPTRDRQWSQRMVGALAEQLRDRQLELRRAVARAAGAVFRRSTQGTTVLPAGTLERLLPALIAAHGSDDPQLRTHVVYAVAGIVSRCGLVSRGRRRRQAQGSSPLAEVRERTGELTPILVAGLRREASRGAAAGALTQLGISGRPRVVDAMRRAYAVAKPGTRRAIVYALSAVGPAAKAAVPLLLGALKTGTPADRPALIRALGRIGDPAAVPALIRALRSEPSDLRDAGAAALRGMRSFGVHAAAVEAALREGLRTDPKAGRRQHLVTAASKLPTSRAVPLLTLGLKDGHQGVCVSAARALEKHGVAAIPALLQASNDVDFPAVRRQAGWSLTRVRRSLPPVPLPQLVGELSSSDLAARRRAAWGIPAAAARDPVALAALVKALDDADVLVRCLAARTLKRVGWTVRHAVTPKVVPWLESDDRRLRDAAVHALSRLASKADHAAVPHLTALVGDPRADGTLLGEACQALGRIGPAARVALQPLADLARTRSGLGHAACSAIGRLPAEAAAPVLVALLGEKPTQLGFAARYGLRLLGKRAVAVVPQLIALAARSAKARPHALGALGSIKDPRGLRVIKAALGRPADPAAARAACVALRGFPRQDVRDATLALRALAAHRDRRLRRAALATLGWLPDPGSIASFRAALKGTEVADRSIGLQGLYTLATRAPAALSPHVGDVVLDLVRVLERALTQPPQRVRWLCNSALNTLGALGPDARVAIPLLERGSRSPDPTIARSAKRALSRVQK